MNCPAVIGSSLRMALTCAALSACISILPASAIARTAGEAHDMARTWVGAHRGVFGGRFGAPSGEVMSASIGGTNLFHSVALAGGGFVVVSDADGAMLAFSGEGRFSETNAAPLWTMLLADTGVAPSQRAMRPLPIADPGSDAPELPDGVSVARTTVGSRLLSATSVTTESGIEDLRVSPLVESKWNQSTVSGKKVYNYYTPGNAVCGCVATAMSQIMRCHEYPTYSVSAKTKACLYNGSQTNLTMQGGTYSWSDMPLVPSSSISSAQQQQAIGKLTSDAGISVHMQYTSSSSGASVMVAAYALTNTWHFAQSQYWVSDQSGEEADGYLPSETLENAILANLDAGFPCMLGISGSGGGHAIVADGYGYVGSQRYVHLNMGWSGSCDYWYCFPVSAGGYTFSYLDEVVYNLFPTNTGNIVSGRVTSTNGTAIAGASVSWSGYTETTKKSGHGPHASTTTTYTPCSGATTTSDTGTYAFIVPNAAVSVTNVTVEMSGFAPSAANGISTSVSKSYVVAISYIEEDPTDLRYYTSTTPAVGNSWGNDLALAAYYVEPSFAATPALSATDGSLTLVTEATAGTTWTLQWNNDLSDSDGWMDLVTFTATGVAQSIVIDSSVFDWTSVPCAFFRLAQKGD